MNIWHAVDAKRVTPEEFIACIEISAGSKNKYELDKETGALILDRILFTATHYPHNYGFIPHTLSEDGDPLDVLVICSEPIVPLALTLAKPIGLLEMNDTGFLDEKVIAVCSNDPLYNGFTDICQLPAHVSDEIRHFFTVYKELENGKHTEVKNIRGRDAAKEAIAKDIAAYEKTFLGKPAK
jgi:inorganic pyrophosphatase